MAIRVAICDDEPAFAKAVEDLMLAYDDNIFEIDMYYNPYRLIEALKLQTYDLFILDIEFPNLSGLEIAEMIRESNTTCPIMFVTSYNEYMEKAFKVNTFDYLLKPITEENLFPALKRALKYLDVDDSKFLFSFNKNVFSVNFREIMFFEKDRRKVRIHTTSGTYESLLKTKELLPKLTDQFVQVHHSFIVNVRHVKKVSSLAVTLKINDEQMIEIPISRKFMETAKNQILMKLREML